MLDILSTVPRVYVLSDDDIWHVSTVTYPSQADTVCGRKEMPISVATTSVEALHHPGMVRHRRCAGCHLAPEVQ